MAKARFEDMAVIPHLGKQGYIYSDESPGDILQKEFSHMFECDHSQSLAWAGKVDSMQWLIREHSIYPQELASKMKRMLFDTYSKYFNDVDVDVSVSDSDEDGSGEYIVTLSVTIESDGSRYSLGRELSVNASKETVSVIKAINA